MVVDNYKNERFKTYETLEQAINELKDYVRNDCLYEEYIENRNARVFDDTEILSINHTKALIKVLEELKKMKEMEMNKNDTM